MKKLFIGFGIVAGIGVAVSIIMAILLLTCREAYFSIAGQYISQVLSSVALFGLSAWIGIKVIEKDSVVNLIGLNKKMNTRTWLMLVGLALVELPAVSFIEEWNKNIEFPQAFAGVEVWLRMMESQATALMEMFINSDSFLRLILNIVVLAAIPAMVEELMFRGWIQRNFCKITNHHTAIWVTALIFSAIHMQFYGFIPRMLLGAVLGYAYFYTRSLWSSIIIHFVNNTMAVIGGWLVYKGVLEEEMHVQSSIAIASLAISITIIYYVYKYNCKENIEK
ncbi:MAG: CPBP family intramembrane metalloprotease [Paludibacteraceae bacterium]|nr:CPBP family intramembrane metalloprotease [Paludibacteraceae bacterium]